MKNRKKRPAQSTRTFRNCFSDSSCGCLNIREESVHQNPSKQYVESPSQLLEPFKTFYMVSTIQFQVSQQRVVDVYPCLIERYFYPTEWPICLTRPRCSICHQLKARGLQIKMTHSGHKATHFGHKLTRCGHEFNLNYHAQSQDQTSFTSTKIWCPKQSHPIMWSQKQTFDQTIESTKQLIIISTWLESVV